MKAKKKFGQNFLKNDVILNDIASSIKVDSNDLIIEIGPGMGALTEKLYIKNTFLICYEIDTDMQTFLDKYNTDRSEVKFEDFLNADLLLDIKKYSYKNIYVIANIPYYITTPIITKLINFEENIKEMVLLVQKEVAERLCADYKTRDYNALTLFVNFDYDSNILFDVDRNNFNPVPNVDSAVIKLSKKDIQLNINKDMYFKFVRDCFRAKRKTLKNNLSNYDFSKIKSILEDLGYFENIRAEEIKQEDFIYLYQKYIEK